MDSSFYATLCKDSFKYFIRDGAFYVYGSDIKMLPVDAQGKVVNGAVKLQSIDAIVKELLLEQRISVEEYDGTVLSRRGHPGSLGDFTELCLGDTPEPTVCAVRLSKGCVEFAVAMDGMIRITSFTDDDLFSGLSALVASYGCVEMLVADKDIECAAARWGLATAHVRTNEDPSSVLNTHLQTALPVVAFERDDVCVVDLRDFDLVDFGCVTAQGRRLLMQWLRAPCVNRAEIARRLDLTEAFVDIDPSLRGCADLRRLAARIRSGRLSIAECVRIHKTVLQIPQLLLRFRNVAGTERSTNIDQKPETSDRRFSVLNEDFIVPLENIYKAFAPFIAEVDTKIDTTIARIRPDLTPRLAELAAARNAVCSEIEAEFLVVRGFLPRVRYIARAFRVPRSDYTPAAFEAQHLVVLSIQKTGVSFLTAGLSARRDALATSEAALEAEEAKVFDDIRANMLSVVDSLETYSFITAQMDIYRAFSSRVGNSRYSRPILSNGCYAVYGFFHPLLEHRDVVSNNLAFDETNDNIYTLGGEKMAENKSHIPSLKETISDRATVAILTGPNMGGKSTILKALSMVSLYAQVGCYVPATRAVLPVFDRIFLRVGARDHASRGLSTFMVEMLDLARILRGATTNSLVLVDELGRGTSALDGRSLVAAVIEHLSATRCYSLLATHFSGLGGAGTRALRMGVAGGTLTYRLETGASDSSFGIATAERAGLPPKVIADARRYMGL